MIFLGLIMPFLLEYVSDSDYEHRMLGKKYVCNSVN